MKTTILFTAILLLTLTSCRPVISTETEGPLFPTSTVVSTLSVEDSLNTSECLNSGSPAEFSFPQDSEQFKSLVFTYLNEGGNLDQLLQLLQGLSDKTERPISLSSQVVDLNGDEIEDIVIISQIFADEGIENAIWVFSCQNGKYLDVGPSSWRGSFWFPTGILSTEDLNNDGKHETVVHVSVGGSGCSEQFMVIGWDHGRATNYLDLEFFECGTELSIQDQDNDGQKELVFTGETRTDRYGGPIPSRNFIYTYEASDLQTYRRISEEYLPSRYRIYTLADAQRAFGVNYTLASQLYFKAANDESLLDVNSYPYDPELLKEDHPREYATAFALFRLVTIDAYVGLDDELEGALRELNQRFPANSPGSEFADVANLFVTKIKAGDKLSIACSAVSMYIENVYPLLEQHFNWRYALYYDNGTLCPF